MRKLQTVVIAAVAAAGGLSAIGAGTAVADTSDGGQQVSNLYRPYQECSPQTAFENDIPIAVLGLAGNLDTTCGQFNDAFSG
ncbi:hypothetical protein D9753_22990 [Streptomyces dangxiongensis]|uniref:Secreted protein n=1 Tax=Streptomyces dangxiongensis TaxID=1442032 RepID=A0A3G2JFY3_9ACTN|nr:hypothetical protein [Streptomyces dangxiongensis]AYN41273.1 hypothetical protein D9753_22990 [Streptomyces dangxiongensis]